MSGQRAVYTALIGGHEKLWEQPVAEESSLPFICFTDDPELRSSTWDVRVVEPLLELDPVRSARALKITGHPDLAAYDETLWIDARVQLSADPAAILDEWLDGCDLAIPRHSFRADVVSEFETVLLTGLDESSRLYEQLTHYSTVAPELLEAPAPWSGMVARRHTPDVDRAMREWLLQVLRYSRRDQLSVTHALARAGVVARRIEIDNKRSPVHEWPYGEGRSARKPMFRVSESLQPPVARLGELQYELERLAAETVNAVEVRENRIAALEEEVSRLQKRVERKDARLLAARARVEKLRSQLRESSD